MIEPKDNNICCLAPYNYGLDIDNFELERFNKKLKNLQEDVKDKKPNAQKILDIWLKINSIQRFSENFEKIKNRFKSFFC